MGRAAGLIIHARRPTEGEIITLVSGSKEACRPRRRQREDPNKPSILTAWGGVGVQMHSRQHLQTIYEEAELPSIHFHTHFAFKTKTNLIHICDRSHTKQSFIITVLEYFKTMHQKHIWKEKPYNAKTPIFVVESFSPHSLIRFCSKVSTTIGFS